ncbi:chemotaxis protein CheX [Pelagicoccus sp. SDUM812003]|uniref:chemotaxis protein CheX n=1 Tax=Pelagicoccus sp. SDUM812003 TaxID=3041267 RepID=UPI00280E0631|nr:chemotaxis protein CheX [Pelagicoccus sp. SDUM812003]MDQ8201684.1 chemotaxis protein CheX [Pelagicoccus sp. SDUM812003]
MPDTDAPVDHFDKLARNAVVKVFDAMAGESVTYLDYSCLLTGSKGDFLRRLPLEKGVYAIAVGFFGDVDGKVMLILPHAVAERITLDLYEAKSLDWIEGDSEETLLDTMGEIGNMLAGLVKGGLTHTYPKLMLKTPKVLTNKRLKVDNSKLSIRRQYLFEGFGTKLMIDFCLE